MWKMVAGARRHGARRHRASDIGAHARVRQPVQDPLAFRASR
jgi:hypothetical protein